MHVVISLQDTTSYDKAKFENVVCCKLYMVLWGSNIGKQKFVPNHSFRSIWKILFLVLKSPLYITLTEQILWTQIRLLLLELPCQSLQITLSYSTATFRKPGQVWNRHFYNLGSIWEYDRSLASYPFHSLPTGWAFVCIFVVCWFFFQNQLFGKIISGISSECQTVWILIRPDILSGLILVQTVCKGYQQTTLVGTELNSSLYFYSYFVQNVQQNTDISRANHLKVWK